MSDNKIINPFGDQPEDPNAQYLKDSFAKAQQPAPAIIACDAKGNVKAPEEMKFVAFKDGMMFKHSANKGQHGTRAIHDAAGQVIAVSSNGQMGDIICAALAAYCAAIKQRMAEDAAKSSPSDTATQTPNS